MKDVKITYIRTDDDSEHIIEMDALELLKDWYNECGVCPDNESSVQSCIIDGGELIGKGLDLAGGVEFLDVMAYIESHLMFPDGLLEKLEKEGIEYIRGLNGFESKLVYVAKNEHVRAEVGTSVDHYVKIIRDCDNYEILGDRDYSYTDDFKNDSEIVLRKVARATNLLDNAIDAGARELADYEY